MSDFLIMLPTSTNPHRFLVHRDMVTHAVMAWNRALDYLELKPGVTLEPGIEYLTFEDFEPQALCPFEILNTRDKRINPHLYWRDEIKVDRSLYHRLIEYIKSKVTDSSGRVHNRLGRHGTGSDTTYFYIKGPIKPNEEDPETWVYTYGDQDLLRGLHSGRYKPFDWLQGELVHMVHRLSSISHRISFVSIVSKFLDYVAHHQRLDKWISRYYYRRISADYGEELNIQALLDSAPLTMYTEYSVPMIQAGDRPTLTSYSRTHSTTSQGWYGFGKFSFGTHFPEFVMNFSDGPDLIERYRKKLRVVFSMWHWVTLIEHLSYSFELYGIPQDRFDVYAGSMPLEATITIKKPTHEPIHVSVKLENTFENSRDLKITFRSETRTIRLRGTHTEMFLWDASINSEAAIIIEFILPPITVDDLVVSRSRIHPVYEVYDNDVSEIFYNRHVWNLYPTYFVVRQELNTGVFVTINAELA